MPDYRIGVKAEASSVQIIDRQAVNVLKRDRYFGIILKPREMQYVQNVPHHIGGKNPFPHFGSEAVPH